MQMLNRAGVLALAFASLISVAAAAPIATQCGRLVSATVKTDIEFFNTSSEQPVIIPNAGVVINVAVGTSRCIRVRFSAVANCPNACFLRAFENSNELNPAWE